MIRLILKIEETKEGICVYDETEKQSPVEAEEKKLTLFLEAFKQVVIIEAKRLAALGRGQTKIGDEAVEKLGPFPEDAFRKCL